MRRLSLQWRVALAAAAAIVLAVALLGVGVQTVLSRQLHGSLDSGLRRRAADIARLNASAPGVLTEPGTLDSALAPPALSIEVLDRAGRVVARSTSLGARLLPVGPQVQRAIARGRSGFADVPSGEDTLRVYVAPLSDLGGGPAAGGAVIVAASTRDVNATLRRVRTALAVGGAAAGLVGAIVALFLSRRALRPLRTLTAGAALVETTGDPARRLGAADASGDVRTLTDTLNRMLAALEAASESERRFVADASHELRTPLTALRGNIDYVAAHGASPEVTADLQADAERLSRLVDDLLVLAREDATLRRADRIELEDVAWAVAADEPRATVVVHRPAAVSGDRDALERAVSNLVVNAARHGPPGGSIVIAVDVEDTLARIAVTDEGPGLGDVTLEEATSRFWRGPGTASANGSGLGLAIVSATAARHGGRLTASGGTFAIELPALRRLSGMTATPPGVESRKDTQ
jgi:two-component system OmpR family sensor kinase